MRADTKLLHSIIFPAHGTEPESTEFPNQAIGPINSYTTQAIYGAQFHATSVETYQYLRSLIGHESVVAHNIIWRFCTNGNFEMVRFLLDSGAHPHGSVLFIPLIEACKKGHEDIVDLLLERGADPNFPYKLDPNDVELSSKEFLSDINECLRPSYKSSFSMAAKAGSISIAKRLIDHEVDLGLPENGMWALHFAVENEDTAMVRFLFR